MVDKFEHDWVATDEDGDRHIQISKLVDELDRIHAKLDKLFELMCQHIPQNKSE